MPAYLAHAMTVLETARWLRTVRDGLRRRRARKRGALSLLDDRLLYFAERSLAYLEEEALTIPEQRLPLTTIENGVGNGFSKFAMVGALGPDIPAASHILAQNHEWVTRTMHQGAPRRSWVDARSTTFVLALLDQARTDSNVSPAERRRIISYALGHLSHIAADVLISPLMIRLLIEHADNPDDPIDAQKLEVELDARLAHAYFQRDDLHSGQSWEAYYLDKGDYADQLEKLMGVTVEAFKKAYGSDKPQEFLCKLDLPDRCRAPKVDTAFLMDGYRNTTNWALDEGYDHGPWSLKLTLSLLIVAGGVASGLLTANSVGGFDTISHWLFNANDQTVTDLNNKAVEEWNNEGLEAADPWLTILDNGFSWADYASWPFAWIMGGHIALTIGTFGQVPDGIFGQGTASSFDQNALKAVWTVTSIVKTVTLIALDEAVPEFTEHPAWKWSWFFGDLGLDFVEHYVVDKEKPEENLEADRLGHALFWPTKILGVVFAASNALVLARKHGQVGEPDANGVRPRETGISGWDVGVSLVIPALASIVYVWWPYPIHEHILEDAAGIHWPDTTTDRIDASLPFATDGEGRRRIDPTGATRYPVHLFKDDPSVIKAQAGRFYYPEDEQADRAFVERDRADRLARRTKSTPTAGTDFSLPELLDHAVAFSGLLSLAGAAHEEAPSDALRKDVKAVFKDWNLDHLLERQWNELMSAAAPDLGLVPLMETWAKDLVDNKDASDAAIENKLQSLFGVREYAGRIEADFKHDNASIDVPEARASRLLRPGAVLLPNLDYAEVPDPLPPVLVSRVPLLDATVDATITPPETDSQLSRMRVRRSSEPGVPGAMKLRLHAADAARVRVFRKTPDTPDKWVVVLGNKGGGVTATEFAIGTAEPPETEYVIECMAFAGDPKTPAPSAPGPFAPAPYSSSAARTGVPVVDARAPSDVWVELVHEEGGAEVRDVRDVALFTIAPFLLLPNTLPSERLYVTYNRDIGGSRGNHPTVADIVNALRSDPGLAPNVDVRLVPGPPDEVEFEPHQPVRAGVAGEAKLVHLIDGSKYSRDPWVQDEFEIGYVFAPHAWTHVVLHNPRERELKDFVRNELAAPAVAVFDGVAAEQSSLEYGGNLEVSPPVDIATDAEPVGAAGPPMPAHKPAPLGKVVIGEGRPELFDIGDGPVSDLDRGRVSDELAREFRRRDLPMKTTATVTTARAGQEWFVEAEVVSGILQRYWIRKDGGKLRIHLSREAAADYRRFLEAQGVQPVVAVDTSWLKVGHVDEFMCFVPAVGGKPFRLVMASSALAIKIFKAALDLHLSDPVAHPLTDVHRGRWWGVGVGSISVADLLSRMGDFNRQLQTARLDPIEARLRRSLHLAPTDVVHLPVAFEEVPARSMRELGAFITPAVVIQELRTAAYTPDLVNMQVFDKHMLVPKPFSARMKVADAIAVLQSAGMPPMGPAVLSHLVGHSFWTRRGVTAADLSGIFGVAAATIRGDPKNAGKFSGAGAVIKNWDEIWIPEDNVDLIEAFVDRTLRNLGLTVHFIDDWDWYHRAEGEVHCGTNVKRTPAEAVGGYAGKQWWDAYPA